MSALRVIWSHWFSSKEIYKYRHHNDIHTDMGDCMRVPRALFLRFKLSLNLPGAPCHYRLTVSRPFSFSIALVILAWHTSKWFLASLSPALLNLHPPRTLPCVPVRLEHFFWLMYTCFIFGSCLNDSWVVDFWS